jgi:hypothetical protein
MKHYDLELTVVLDDHGYQQALGLQAKTGRTKSKIVKWTTGKGLDDGYGISTINSDGSVSADAFVATKWVRINFIGHGDSGSTVVSDTAGTRKWSPTDLATGLRKVVYAALPKYGNYKFKRLSMIVCYGGGHTYSTLNSYGHHVHPKDSFGFKFFDQARSWITDMTARGDISITSMSTKGGSAADSLNYQDYLGATKKVGDDGAHHDKYRKVRFYEESGQVKVEWPYKGYD